MPPRRARDQQDDDAPPRPPPRQLTPYERASVDILARITRLERQSERPGKSHEEDVVERFRNQGPEDWFLICSLYREDSSFELFPKLVFLGEPSWLYDDYSSAPPACRFLLVQAGLWLVVQRGIAYSAGDWIYTRSLRLYLSSHSITALVRCT
ncbi:hypothetical protein F511_34541 [Dorcoceras hygrometricum]|uniref:Uncharacterized protein n=1 Tax=Dorcoceras hygrometricum TaxID=472368 RepID=A0A2Z7AFQ9_9LAMI|nr:hypothetical protein F511_34541 [Dorcoceras hygrometricum]